MASLLLAASPLNTSHFVAYLRKQVQVSVTVSIGHLKEVDTALNIFTTKFSCNHVPKDRFNML